MARNLTEKEQIIEDLTICPGTGATKSVVFCNTSHELICQNEALKLIWLLSEVI